MFLVSKVTVDCGTLTEDRTHFSSSAVKCVSSVGEGEVDPL